MGHLYTLVMLFNNTAQFPLLRTQRNVRNRIGLRTQRDDAHMSRKDADALTESMVLG